MKSAMPSQSAGNCHSLAGQAWNVRQKLTLLLLILSLFIFKSSCGQEWPHIFFSISEDASVGDLVGVVVGSRFSPPYERWLQTQSESDNSTMAGFNVDLNSGRITIRGKLDREEKDKHTIVIDASSVETKLVIVEITVLDVNDMTPTFQNPQMTDEISESAPENTKISLGSVRDRDLGENSTKTVEIVSGNEEGAFFLQVTNNSNIDKVLDLVVTAQQLDFETTSEYHLVIRATDGGGRYDEMRVTIVILDQNDNTPVFNTSKYSARIPENVTTGTPVIKVEATDTDSGEKGRITYSIARGSDPEEYFMIDKRTGQITINKPLDYETKPEFLLTLEARDNGETPQLGTAVLDIIVENVNEQSANISLTFEPDFKDGFIREDVAVDTLIAVIGVQDPDIAAKPNALTKLYGDKGFFELRLRDGRRGLYVKTQLDRELHAVYEMTVVVTDVGSPPLSANKEFKLTIDDVNDNPPVFELPTGSGGDGTTPLPPGGTAEYIVDLEETVEVGKEVLKVSASDKDVGPNGQVTYVIQEATSNYRGWFGIDAATGVITTRATVDCEVNPQPVLTVVARDGGEPPKMATAQVVIHIWDVSDNQPVFDTSFYNFTVAENRRVGDCIITVSASDPECGVSSPVVYQMSRTLAPLPEFTINSKTGEICIGTQLNFEATKRYQFQVEAVDSDGLSAEAVVQVEVMDVNDNHPRFEPRAYPINLTSRSRLGPLIFVQARDLDSGVFGTVTYSIISGNDKGYFYIDPVTGSVSLVKALSDDKALYTLGVRATDGGGLTSKESGEVRISFISGDVHPPIFSQTMFNFTVKEDVDTDTLIGQVEATLAGDKDDTQAGEKDDSPISYSSIFQTEDWFTVDRITGKITTKEKLDRERHPFILISMHAEAHFPPTFAAAQVNVTILDVNDNPPVFPVTTLQLDVREDEPVGNALYFARAHDLDKGNNGKIRYRLLNEPHEKFQINPDQGQINLREELDYEKEKQYTLTVIAEDFGSPSSRSSSMTLTVRVKDVNDNTPIFNNKVYNFYVSENVPIGHSIDVVSASDEDSDHNGRISYMFRDNSYKYLFGISPIEGTVWTRGNLDRELHEVYELTVEAVDHGSPKPLSSSALVRIYVKDMNDNFPVFSMDYYRFEIEENVNSGKVFGKVIATDADSGKNGKVRFSFAEISSEFFINSGTGEIETSIRLDHEESSNYTLTVLAVDEGDSAKSSSATVRIDVLDENDNSPVFEWQTSNRLTVKENKRKGTQIAQMTANDPDAGSNGRVTFFFHPEMSDSAALTKFAIHSRSGWITTSEVLDYEARQRYEVVVVARDGGSDPKESFLTLVITVEDVDDRMPLFPSEHVDFSVMENADINTEVGRIQVAAESMGRDGGKVNVSYHLVGGNVFSAFAINRNTGVITTIKEIDYEAASFHNLSIQAVDGNAAIPKSSNVTVTVTVLDINDNSPEFDTDPVVIRMVKEGTAGDLIHTFLATDLDSSINGTVRYSIQSYSGQDEEGDMGPYFDIDAETGEMTVIREIDHEKVQQISVIVKAEDLCPGCAMFSWITTIVYVTDVNDNAPVFESASSISVPEDQAISYPILVVVAVDSDSNIDNSGNNIVRYAIVAGNEDGKFHLAEDTGYLTIQNHLDYETKKRYVLNVSASDSGNPKITSYQTIRLSITDVNDNVPIFLQTLYVANITENKDPQSNITRVQARDADTGENGRLVYSITEGLRDDKFSVDPSTGVISTKKQLDREQKDSYLITVYVRDDAQPFHFSSCTVSITVLDKNDNAPVFKQPLYTVQIPENLGQSSMLSIAASDRDEGDNARITYSITGGNDGHFTIDSERGHLSTEPLDRETKDEYNLTITVSDRGIPPHAASTTVIVTVIDENDNSPVFTQPVYTSSIKENVREGTFVLTVRANDTDLGENGEVTYSVGNDSYGLFEIDSHNGTITTSGVFDREKRSNYSFLVTATDHGVTGPRNSSARVDVEITDINDNAPVFTLVPYFKNLPVGTPSKELILTVKATDADASSNGPVEYSLASNTSAESVKYFRLDRTSGGIYSKVSLNTPGRHSMLVIATDSAFAPSSRLSSTGVVEIIIGSSEADRFEFEQNSYVAEINENSPRGVGVTTVTAKYDSHLVPSPRTQYSFASGNEYNVFTIDVGTGEIKVNDPKTLDYESTHKLRLIVKAKDGNRYAYATLEVNLKDKNDNPPKFSQSKYVSAIWENNEPQTYVTQIEARDLDSGMNGLVVYTIIGGNDEGVFEINKSHTGIIRTHIDAAPLDRDSRPEGYRLVIEARDLGIPMKSSTCILVISIVDENDTPPLFPSIGPRNVSESREVGYQVAMVTANDVDLNSVLVYDFTTDGNPRNTFSLDRSSGGLSLAKPLDYEDITHYSVGIQVSDGKADHTQTIWLDVNVEDENDNAPVFAQSSYKVQLPEQTERLQPVVTVRATDKDSGPNAQISYSMASSPVDSFFMDSTGTIYTNRTIYYTSEQSIIQLVVIATDHGKPPQSAMVAVHIQITDVNKYAPKFIQPKDYIAHISELAQKGHSVLNVTAIDEDKLDREDSIDYDIVGHGKELFHIKQRTGEIIYNGGGADYEQKKQYTLFVVATDRGTPPKNTSLPVTIYIDDENDNAPKFLKDHYVIEVDENYPPLQKFANSTIIATDADSGPNAELKFTITSGNTEGIFHNPNWEGDLWIVKGMELDYEMHQKHRLILRAVDCVTCPPSSARLSAFTTIDIIVNDVNEFHPVFPVKHYLEDLMENSTIGTVVFTAHALDGDGGQYGVLEYSLMRDMDYQKFTIDKDTGEVRALAEFDYENQNTKKLYNLKIVARETSGHHDWADVTIRLIDKDDNDPEFAESKYSFDIPGSARVGDFIGQVSASDDDAGEAGMLVYTFVNPNPYFHIDPFSGNITVALTLHEEASSNDPNFHRKKRALTSKEEEMIIQVSSGQPGSRYSRTSCLIAIDRVCPGCAAPVGSLHSDEGVDGGILAGIVLACIIVVIITIIGIIIFVYHRRNPRKSVPNYSSDSTMDLEPPPCLPTDRAYVDVIRNTRHQRSNHMISDTSDQSHNSASSGRGSAEAEEEDEEITRINSRNFMHSSQAFRQKAMPDSGIQHDDDTLSESTAQTHQEYLANLGIDTTKIGKPKATMKHLGRSAESMHQFSDEGGGEGGVDTDFEKITDFETDEETLAQEKKGQQGVSFLEPDTHNVGSLSNVINSEEVNSGSYNWDYLIDWGPQYQPLAHVFSEIAKLKDESIKPKKQLIKTVPQRQFSGLLKQPKVRTVPPPIITNAPPMARVEGKPHHYDQQGTQVSAPHQLQPQDHHHMHHHHQPHPHHPRDHPHHANHHPHHHHHLQQDQSLAGTSHPAHPHFPHTNNNHINNNNNNNHHQTGGYSYQPPHQQPRSMPPYQYQPIPQHQQKLYHPPPPQHHPPPPPQRNHHAQQFAPAPPSNPPPPLPDKDTMGQQSSSSDSRSRQASTTNISLPSLPRSPISYESSITSAAMTPSLTPSLSPLATRSPSISPVVSSGHNTPGQNGNVPRSKTHSLSSSSEKEFTI